MKIRCSTNRNTSKSIKAAKLSQRSLQKKGRNRYTIMYSEIYNAPDADTREMFHEFEAQIIVSNPYDDADYVWASISNGVINYVKNGKVIDKSYYMDADDMDVENDEWCDVVIEQALENLESYNSKVESRIIHSSSDIRSKTQDNGYWFFTRHGVQPGSVPKDVEILDIVDTPNGTFVKLNRFLSTKELDYYDIIEKAPEGITSAESTKISWNDMELVDQLAAIQNYVKEYEGTRVFEDFAEYVNADVDDVIDLFSDMESRNMLRIPYVIQKDSEFANDDIYSSEEITSEDSVEDDVYEDINEIGQEFTSENTSINSKKLPAVFNMVSFNPGTVNLDYGGGRFNNVAEYLKQYDVINLVYDPYNRSAEHNQEVIRIIREHGGADTATCSNVLNVIKEPEVRLNVLKNISKLVKSGGTVYITVYEGKGNNAEGPTKSGYQLNRKTADYLEEIQQVFPDAKRKGKLIECINSGAITSSIYDENDNIYSSTTSDIILKLKEELKSAVTDTMLSEEFGFSENEAEQYSAVDVYVKDNSIVCEIRAEVSFDGLMELCDNCNPVVEKYYKDAYFDPEEPGIATAYIPINDVTGAITAMEDSMIDPPDYEEPDVFDEEFELEIDLTGVVVKVEDDTLDLDESSIEITPDSGDDDFVNDYGMYIDDVSGVEEKILDLVKKDIPDAEGRYKLSGYAYLIYNVEGLEMYTERYGEDDFEETVYTDRAKKSYDASKSYTKNLTVRKMI